MSTINPISLDLINRIVEDEELLDALIGDEGIFTLAPYDSQAREYAIDFLRDGIVDQVPSIRTSGSPGYVIVLYTEGDEFTELATDEAISTLISGYRNLLTEDAISAYKSFWERVRPILSVSVNSVEDIREHFWSSSGIPGVQYPRILEFDSSDLGANSPVDVLIQRSKERLEIWKDFYAQDLDPEEDQEELEQEESNFVSEETEEYELDIDINPDLVLIADAVSGGALSPSDSVNSVFIFNAFRGREVSNQGAAYFYRVFQTTENITDVDEAYLPYIFDALKTTGLLELASYAYEIGNFAQKRFASTISVQANANDFVDPVVDLAWLTQLAQTKESIEENPVLFATVLYYFPSLVTFYLDAIATVVDYSNGGLGGGYDDENIDLFYETITEVFGLEPIRSAAKIGSYITTSERIKKVIESAPFRRNIAPKSPDIFHLRLGAANFYVPPISINVNTQFKAGSLTGGAIRQQNSPKFNTGHRETVVNMRLFFPNYQEIWGLSLDPDSAISLNDDFEIDFRYLEDESGNRVLGDSEEKIDKFLSSLRGLVAAFKYSPILPVRNDYLNRVHNITGVALSNMTVSTVPNFPFALAVDIELLHFNHNPYLPMIKDFNQAIHWGKYRQYIGKAASTLHRYVNEDFLIKTSDVKDEDFVEQYEYDPLTSDVIREENYYYGDALRTNVINEWRNGNNISLYAPAEVQTKLYLPDSSSFRTPQERFLNDSGESNWRELLAFFGIDLNEAAGYGISLSGVLDLETSSSYTMSKYQLVADSIDILTAGLNSSDAREAAYNNFIESFISENSNKLGVGDFGDETTSTRLDWLRDYSETEAGLQLSLFDTGDEDSSIGGPFFNNGVKMTYIDQQGDEQDSNLSVIKYTFWKASQRVESYLDYLVDREISRQSQNGEPSQDRESVKQDVAQEFNLSLFDRLFSSGTIQQVMEAVRERNGDIKFSEWEVPMIKVDLDPDSVFVNGVNVSLTNNFAKLQVQMQDEPTYQHIGGRDSYVSIAMTVIGESELIKLKRVFDHISSLARLEHASGVIGFLGIKNAITALTGIKYVVPLNYTVNTEPNYPHVYRVNLTLIDFDIFQQKREQLSNKQQKELMKDFTTKKNPFLRLKQSWSAFNAYPDLPLQVKNAEGDVVGHFDPDFYFRSFEMFDEDVINNVSTQQPKIQDFFFDEDFTTSGISTSDIVAREIEYARIKARIAQIVDSSTGSQQDIVNDLVDFVKEENVSRYTFFKAYEMYLGNPLDEDVDYNDYRSKWNLLTAFISFREDEDSEVNPFMEEVNPGGYYQVGNLSPHDFEMKNQLEAALAGEFALENEGPNGEDYVSFDPEAVDFHKIIFLFPALGPEELNSNRASAIMSTALGNHFGYMDRTNGRFYLTVSGSNVIVDSQTESLRMRSNLTRDVQTPDTGNTTVNSGIPSLKGVSDYQNAYAGNEYSHWEKMLVDTSYRDISGRMLRAFPTYMLWLIDEGGYFAGAKLFDNFYGLQSIIDFSVISSEDLLGDTLVLRLSNMYSKLTTPQSTKIFNPYADEYSSDELDLTEGLGAVIERAINMANNLNNHMKHSYEVDINNIRLKPGVRVHLRGGYGANPNSLQTLFNGIITNVEQGEIVTVTAQSDAIELGAMVNSTNKKGDSGKIDGGIDTGLWMSEPRDLMVRLLSMGASRTREAIARATRGTVFSENRFGIRHFGSMLYEPITESEREKNRAIADSISGAYSIVGGESGITSKAIGALDGFTLGGGETSRVASMSRLFANMSAQVDLELFKRNIYPGNGTGIAQFLGGDLDDGWSTVASIVPEDTGKRASSDLALLTDVAWNRVVANSSYSLEATSVVDNLTQDSVLNQSNAGNTVSNTIAGLAGIASFALAPTPVGLATGTALTGILSGRGGQNLFKTMGVISTNPDDDLAGFDEVSFKAQTYMRTVWDMFQLCARLLPNYIVSIRPFEDRSTVFYGKPHWLYTSGVVPVTMGYKFEEGPKERESDDTLIDILDQVNRESNSLADYAAYLQAKELSNEFVNLSESISQSTGVYAPTSYLQDKIINFDDIRTSEYRDPSSNELLAKIPLKRGYVDIGFHLPVGQIEEPVNRSRHRQIPNLPPRYQYPFFANTELIKLESGATLDTRVEEKDGTKFGDAYKALKKAEEDFLKETEQTLVPNSDSGIPNLDLPLNLQQLNNAIDSSAISLTSPQKVRMPYPESFEIYSDFQELRSEYRSKFYESDWGAPETEIDEQFYIAMRWPYNPSTVSNEDLEAFKDQYISYDRLWGTAQDYKNRKVIVYNPANKRAVICRPAYFLWGDATQEKSSFDTRAQCVVSPDAAYYLGIITVINEQNNAAVTSNYGFREWAQSQECYFGFVPDDVPLGVVSPQVAQAHSFQLEDNENDFLVGFGMFASNGENLLAVENPNTTNNPAAQAATGQSEALLNSLNRYVPFGAAGTTSFSNAYKENYPYSGNVFLLQENNEVVSYMDRVLDGENLDSLGYDELRQVMVDNHPDSQGERNRYGTDASMSFTPVFTEFDSISVRAREFYDEDFSADVSVIAGNGRTLLEAQDVWDQFRYGYHNYDSVKQIFAEVYGMDPDSDLEMPDYLLNILRGNGDRDPLSKFGQSEGGALDEFALILGDDYANISSGLNPAAESAVGGVEAAVEFVRQSFVDAPLDRGGLIEATNVFLRGRLEKIREIFFTEDYVLNSFSLESAGSTSLDPVNQIATSIRTPRQLFLFLVGAFRQALWSETSGYGRAWVVLKPDARLFGKVDNWSLKPIDPVFREFINPYNDYAKNESKFKQLLVSTRSEGNSASNIVSYAFSGLGDFFSANVGPVFSAISDGLSGLLSMFKLSMQQMGYALSQQADFRKHSHILNKALNDSIYYSLGREGSVLRAVDNPFTREYGEPVIEVREPFQRIHYINSFSHILKNHIEENINNVATTVTAVSDGKYPVTVALDKGAPSERQVEKTVETGLYFDNMVGSGFFGFLHPLMHPLETARGVAKNLQGSPDELSARRVALAHLKESIKDVYGGELMVIGNADIRPHDLVYLADVYERMYGLFEVEQVIHHFTSEMGFVTSITPNALVTVNDPARWFLSSWIHSWLSTQAIRNDTRVYLDNIRDGDSAAIVGGSISIDRLSEMLTPQLVGGVQFTHGSSAVIKDAISLETAKHMPDAAEAVAQQLQATTDSAGGAALASAGFGILAGAVSAIAAPATGGASLAVGAAVVGGSLGSQIAWKGWSWVRDNLLDQHGCYVQYLNKNGQPMDAGLSYNQGMVVGQYHSKALLPGILGVRNKVRTPEGNSHIRSDDLFKSLGWRESEIKQLARYISYENALVHARVLGLSGVGPDRAALEEQFKVLVKVTDDGFIDGDTIKVRDVISGAEFRVRFDGINTAETNVIDGKVEIVDGEAETLSFLDSSSPGGRAKIYVEDALRDKVFVLRINKKRSKSFNAEGSQEYVYDPGSDFNVPDNYQKDVYGRELGIIFYYIQPSLLQEAQSFAGNLFRSVLGDSLNYNLEDIVDKYKESFTTDSVFFARFKDIYDSVYETVEDLLPTFTEGDVLLGLSSEADIKTFSTIVYMRCLNSVFETASSWPKTSWDSYYSNGYPVTLNWELVVNNLAKVYVKDLQTESESVQTASEQLNGL